MPLDCCYCHFLRSARAHKADVECVTISKWICRDRDKDNEPVPETEKAGREQGSAVTKSEVAVA